MQNVLRVEDAEERCNQALLDAFHRLLAKTVVLYEHAAERGHLPRSGDPVARLLDRPGARKAVARLDRRAQAAKVIHYR